MTPAIVPATPEDAGTILAIQKRAFAEEARLCGRPDIPPLTETLEAILAHIQNETVLTAREEGRIVGSVRGIVSGSVCTLRALAIEPAMQGRGLGTLLLSAIECAHPLVTRFELLTNTVMAGNIRFYERHGYRVEGIESYSETISLARMGKAAPVGGG
jgi:GNAT superfamily N-acetyltransferase